MKLLQYTWKNSMMKIANSKMAVFVILMIVVSRSYVGLSDSFQLQWTTRPLGAYFHLRCVVFLI